MAKPTSISSVSRLIEQNKWKMPGVGSGSTGDGVAIASIARFVPACGKRPGRKWLKAVALPW
jgi:hypothetical protein